MKVYLDFEINKIQELRLIHAIIEQGLELSVPKEQEYKFKPLKEKFNMTYFVSDLNGIGLSELIKINHELPNTEILNIICPLIYPKVLVDYLYNNWAKNKAYKFSFSGLITPVRHHAIQNWLTNQLQSEKTLNYNSKSFKNRVLNRIIQLQSNAIMRVHKYDDLYISNSNKGRQFPDKSWDEEYYNFLLNSRFVLCPSGDYVWSYRFFEAILCGAIPVIEEFCSVYEGYRFVFFRDDANNLKYNLEDALYNYKLCISRITINDKIIF